MSKTLIKQPPAVRYQGLFTLRSYAVFVVSLKSNRSSTFYYNVLRIASVSAIKKMPPMLPSSLLLAVFDVTLPGKAISKNPKNERAKKIKMAKKEILTHALVEMVLNISGLISLNR
jgi:hypothetical protein